MKVLLFSHTFLPTIGGRELVVYYLADALSRQGHEVQVFGAAGWWRHRRVRYGYPVCRHPNLLPFSFRSSGIRRDLREWQMGMHLRLRLARFRADVIHAHTTYPTGHVATRWAGDTPVVVTPHGVDIDTIPEVGYGLRLDEELKPRIDQAVGRASATTAISRGIHTSLTAVGADERRLFDVPNGVDLERFSGAPESDVRTQLGFPPHTRLIVTVGNHHPRKGQELLIKATKEIVEEYPDARLVVVGKGADALEGLVADLGIRDQVVLAGSVPLPASFGSPVVQHGFGDDFLADLLRSATVYVSASTTEGAEGLSLAVLEAMAAGLPVVATEITGNRDIVRPGETGILVEPSNIDALRDGISRILGMEDQGRHMGHNGRVVVAERYGWDAIAKQYVEVYRWCCNRPDARIASACESTRGAGGTA